jgi:hypothetical protein
MLESVHVILICKLPKNQKFTWESWKLSPIGLLIHYFPIDIKRAVPLIIS